MNRYSIQIEFIVKEDDVNHDFIDNLDSFIELIKNKSNLHSIGYILREGLGNIEPKVTIQQIKN